MLNRSEAHPAVLRRTFSLAEVAVVLCGHDGPTEQRWVLDHLRGYQKPALPGFKVQRKWRMTQEDLDASIELLRPKRTDDVPAMTSLTARSQRRMAV